MKVIPTEYTFDDVITFLENNLTNSFDCLNYGKSIQKPVEIYVQHMVNQISGEKILIDLDDYPHLIDEFNYKNNGPGFDKLLHLNNKKIQIKFRQVNGKTPYSRQVHFENTRRHSQKNQNESAKSGFVTYSNSEFDFVIIVLCHIVDFRRPHHKNWNYSIISSQELEDVNNKGYCLPKIPSELLFENKLDDIYMLTDKLKKLQYE